MATDAERIALENPVTGSYYFVIDTAVFWTYQDDWIPLTTSPEQIVFIGTDAMPELGSTKTLYVSKTNKEISVWDKETNSYIVVSNKTEVIGESDIDLLFA